MEYDGREGNMGEWDEIEGWTVTHRHGGLSELEVAVGEGGLVRAAQGRVSKVTVKMVVMIMRILTTD